MNNTTQIQNFSSAQQQVTQRATDVKSTSKEFAVLFISTLLKDIVKTEHDTESSLDSSSEIFNEMLASEYAKAIASSNNFGIEEDIEKIVTKDLGGQE